MKIVSSCIYDLKIKSRMDEIKTVTVEFLSFLFLFHNCFILNLKKYTSISCNDVGMFHFDTFMNYNLIFHLILLADHENFKLSLNKGILIKRKIEYYSLKLHVHLSNIQTGMKWSAKFTVVRLFTWSEV